jgi:hypothetical protein
MTTVKDILLDMEKYRDYWQHELTTASKESNIEIIEKHILNARNAIISYKNLDTVLKKNKRRNNLIKSKGA